MTSTTARRFADTNVFPYEYPLPTPRPTDMPIMLWKTGAKRSKFEPFSSTKVIGDMCCVFEERSQRLERITAILLLGCALCSARAQTIPYAAPRFSDGDRLQKVQAVLPDVDRAFYELAENEKLPGLVYGVVLDGKL